MKKIVSSSPRRPFRYIILCKSKFSDYKVLSEVDIYAHSFSSSALKAEKIIHAFQSAGVDILLFYKEFYLLRSKKQSELPF